MRILHTSDLHIGKMLGDYPLYDETKDALAQVEKAAVEQKVDLVLLAGDIFDRSQPSEQAVEIYNDFLNRLIIIDHIKVMAIAGNHDSGIRLENYSALLNGRTGYWVAGTFKAEPLTVTFMDADEYGPISFFLLPYFKPSEVKFAYQGNGNFDNDNRWNYNDAFNEIYRHLHVDTNHRNILMMHQFVAGSAEFLSGSESFPLSEVGGIDNIGVDHLKDFDYVALGHIHKASSLVRDTIRYSGSLLKYKESEINGPVREFVVFDIKAKGDPIEIKHFPIKPLHDFVYRDGSFNEVLNSQATDDYVVVRLSDADSIPNAADRLRSKFPRLVNIEYPNIISTSKIGEANAIGLDDRELLKKYYKYVTDNDLDEDTLDFLLKIMNDEEEADK